MQTVSINIEDHIPHKDREYYLKLKQEKRNLVDEIKKGNLWGEDKHIRKIIRPLHDKIQAIEDRVYYKLFALNECKVRINEGCMGNFNNTLFNYSRTGNTCPNCNSTLDYMVTGRKKTNKQERVERLNKLILSRQQK